MYFFTTWQIGKFCKVDWKFIFKKVDITFETFKNFNISHLMPSWRSKGQYPKASPTFNLLVTNLMCFFTQEDYFFIVVTYEIHVFFKGAQKEVFSSILKFENVNTWNTMSKTLSKLSLSCAQTQKQQWSSIFKYFQVFFKKPKKTYNTRMFESNWEYVTTMYFLGILYHAFT